MKCDHCHKPKCHLKAVKHGTIWLCDDCMLKIGHWYVTFKLRSVEHG